MKIWNFHYTIGKADNFQGQFCFSVGVTLCCRVNAGAGYSIENTVFISLLQSPGTFVDLSSRSRLLQSVAQLGQLKSMRNQIRVFLAFSSFLRRSRLQIRAAFQNTWRGGAADGESCAVLMQQLVLLPCRPTFPAGLGSSTPRWTDTCRPCTCSGVRYFCNSFYCFSCLGSVSSQ